MALSIINLSILAILINAFIKRYMQIKSEFTMAFLLFSLTLFLRTLFASPILRLIILGEETHSIVDPYRLVADIFELIALSIFFYISTR